MARRLKRILASLLHRRRFEQAVADEMRLHIDEHTEYLVASGMPREQAARQARLAFGSIATARDGCVEAAGLGPFDQLQQDFSHAFRSLRKNAGLSAAAVLTLALGLGVNALMFSVTYGLLVRPLPFEAADELVWIFATEPGTPGALVEVSHLEGEALAHRPSPFSATAAIGDSGLVRELESHHDRWRGIWATTSLFEVLRVMPTAGSVPAALPPEGAPRAIFISFERWTQDFQADPSIVGRELSFADRKRFVVAGVLPRGLEFPFARAPHSGNGAGFQPGVQDYWIMAPDRIGEHPGGVMLGRMAAGRSVEQAGTEVAALPASLPNAGGGRALVIAGLREHTMGTLGRALPLLQMFAAVVLAIACANLVSLMLARRAASRIEIATRVALGARRSDLVRMFLTEAAVLSALGAVLGLGLARMGQIYIEAMAPRHSALVDRIGMDWTTVAFMILAAVVTTLCIGAVPVLSRRDPEPSTLLTFSRATSGHIQRPLRWLVAAQVALSLTLLTAAGTLAASLHRLMAVDAGYDVAGVISAQTVLYIPNTAAEPVLRTLVERLLATPGVEAVGFVHSTPLTGKWTVRDTFEILDGPRRGRTPEIPGSFVAYDYFDVMRTPLLAGRTFGPQDLTTRDFPILINDVAARTFFPGINPVGLRVRMTGRLREIVGVVKATRDLRLDSAPEAQWYQPGLSGTSELLVRVSGRAALHVPEIDRVIRSVDPRFTVERIAPLESIVAETVLERRLAAHLVTGFALLALVLATVGVFGVIHFGVVQRRREFGLRAAIGASRAALMRLVVRQAVGMTMAGVGLGALASIAVSGTLQGLLFETRAASPSVIAAAALGIMVIGVAASLRPAWSAATVDPVRALKAE